MFEQSIYDTEPVATPTQDGDLFHNYEFKSWDLSPRIYKILGFSALGNIIVILIVAQTSLLTMKGCDSHLSAAYVRFWIRFTSAACFLVRIASMSMPRMTRLNWVTLILRLLM